MILNIWENEKRRLADILLQRAAASAETVPCHELIGCGFPELFELLAKNHARKIFDEFQPVALHAGPRYNLQSLRVQRQLTLLENQLVQETLFSKEEIKALAERAVNFQFDVLVRPRQKLLEVLYSSASERKPEDVLVVARGFGDERPFIRKLIRTFSKFDSEIVSREVLQELSSAAERAVYRESPISAFMLEIKLFTEFEAAITGRPCLTIASATVLGLLTERELYYQHAELTEEAATKDCWTIPEVESALQRFWLSPPFDSPPRRNGQHQPGVESPGMTAEWSEVLKALNV
jgi:hypothetical protein